MRKSQAVPDITGIYYRPAEQGCMKEWYAVRPTEILTGRPRHSYWAIQDLLFGKLLVTSYEEAVKWLRSKQVKIYTSRADVLQ